jgi:uncharacterized protein DUF4136
MHRANLCTAWACAALAATGLMSCYPGTIEDTAEINTVTTLFDPNENFMQNATYALPDTIVHICDLVNGNPDCLDITRAYDSQILAKVATEMDALGYTRVTADPANPPDVLLFVSAIASKNYALIGSGCSYWGWYYPYYCYYPPTWTTVEFTTGTLFLTMMDPDRIATGDKIPIVWTGVLNGVISGSANSNLQSALNGIHQAFLQSSYLDVEAP